MSRHDRGFFIIWGSRNRISDDGKGFIEAQCPNCRRPVTLHGKQVRRWFTIYFIPIFPTGSPMCFTQCAACKFQFRATHDEMKAALVSAPAQNSFAGAIALFNELRETPADAVKLEKLLRMYLAMNEPRDAIAAGKAYPQAAVGSENCLTLLAPACLHTGDTITARRYAAAALALNPANAEALRIENQLTSS